MRRYRICYCIGKLGSVATDVLTPIILKKTNSLSWGFWMSAFISIFSFIFVIILNVIDKVNDERRKKLRLLRKTYELK